MPRVAATPGNGPHTSSLAATVPLHVDGRCQLAALQCGSLAGRTADPFGPPRGRSGRSRRSRTRVACRNGRRPRACARRGTPSSPSRGATGAGILLVQQVLARWDSVPGTSNLVENLSPKAPALNTTARARRASRAGPCGGCRTPSRRVDRARSPWCAPGSGLSDKGGHPRARPPRHRAHSRFSTSFAWARVRARRVRSAPLCAPPPPATTPPACGRGGGCGSRPSWG
jgi:hypothetical protein